MDIARLRTDCGLGMFEDMDNSRTRLRAWTGHGRGQTADCVRAGYGRGLVKATSAGIGNRADNLRLNRDHFADRKTLVR